MAQETEYKFLNNVDVENRVVGEFYISRTLKLGKWSVRIVKTVHEDVVEEEKEEYLGGYCPVGEREKFEIWKKENKDLCMERPKNPEIDAVWMHGGVEFRYDGTQWNSKEAREKSKKAKSDWDKTPEGRKSRIFAGWKSRDIEFENDEQKEEVYDCWNGKATHCNNCEICKLTHYPEPISKHTAYFDHCHRTRLPRQIICHNCNVNEAYLRRVNKWKKDDPNFTRFAIINGVAVYLS